MHQQRPSHTAAWVAAARSAARALPRAQQLAEDPYGRLFVAGAVRRLVDAALFAPELLGALLPRLPKLHAFLLWMQLRTRALDDVLQAFVREGGRQVVLLGAGYDARAIRLAHLLRDVRVVEVDHPATQAHKRAIVERAGLRSCASYVSWDFERGLVGLVERLAAQGLTAERRVLTLWEGVTMYLSPPAIEATLQLVRGYGAEGSWLAFTYLDEKAVRAPQGDQRLTQRLVRRAGEPYRSGFAPAALSSWLQERGYELSSDASDRALAERYGQHALARYYHAESRHVALARSAPVARR